MFRQECAEDTYSIGGFNKYKLKKKMQNTTITVAVQLKFYETKVLIFSYFLKIYISNH